MYHSIDARVKKFNSGEWRRKYMTFEQILKEHDRDSFARGLAEGEAAGLERGRSEGEAAGLQKGATREKREIAKKLKSLGMAAVEIVKATGLSEAEVAEL